MRLARFKYVGVSLESITENVGIRMGFSLVAGMRCEEDAPIVSSILKGALSISASSVTWELMRGWAENSHVGENTRLASHSEIDRAGLLNLSISAPLENLRHSVTVRQELREGGKARRSEGGEIGWFEAGDIGVRIALLNVEYPLAGDRRIVATVREREITLLKMLKRSGRAPDEIVRFGVYPYLSLDVINAMYVDAEVKLRILLGSRRLLHKAKDLASGVQEIGHCSTRITAIDQKIRDTDEEVLRLAIARGRVERMQN
ncbi:hypothetical protein DFH09DRAFT_1093494 [Mycena vulgaris]|nr:hypothetical protein DFH09DRAFT_1093494 [Mycena vulgaris]